MISPACLMAGVIYIIIYKERDFPQVIRYILQKVSFSYWIRSLFGYLCLYIVKKKWFANYTNEI